MTEQHFRCDGCGECFTVRAGAELENVGCPNCSRDAASVRRVDELLVVMQRAVRRLR